MGCRVLPYWVATFCFDFSVYIITVIVFLLTIYIGDIKFLQAYVGQMILILVSFGFSYIPFSYMCGFMFKKSSSALKGYPLFNFFVVFNVPFVILGIIALMYSEEYNYIDK